MSIAIADGASTMLRLVNDSSSAAARAMSGCLSMGYYPVINILPGCRNLFFEVTNSIITQLFTEHLFQLLHTCSFTLSIWTIKAMQVLERSVLTAQWSMKLEVDNRLAHPFHQRSVS
ncbi:MAG TPA: hypothetical protein DEP74_04415 [Citrobacter freundii]|nr:hypothetical protein [Citrobacter freundii]